MRRSCGIIGTGEARALTRQQEELATHVGKLIASRGWTLVVGTGSGISDIAARAARSVGGLVIGISPAESREEHSKLGLTLDDYDAIVFTGFGFRGRNVILVRTADALISIGGAFGTLNEISIALAEHKTIALLAATGGVTDILLGIDAIATMPKRNVFHATTAIDAVAFIEEQFKSGAPATSDEH